MERLASMLFIIGVLLVIIGSIVLFFTLLSTGSTSGSVIVIIGPIPVIGAWGEHGFTLTLIALAILIVLLILHFIYFGRIIKCTGG